MTERDTAMWHAKAERVLPSWIDYNGHMNVAYYTMAFDRGLDAFLDELDCGPRAAAAERRGPYALQSCFHYLGELLEGARFSCRFQLLDHDVKRLHVWGEIVGPDGVAAATETLIMNVDLETRRSAPLPAHAAEKVAAMAATQSGLPRPERAGAMIGIRRR